MILTLKIVTLSKCDYHKYVSLTDVIELKTEFENITRLKIIEFSKGVCKKRCLVSIVDTKFYLLKFMEQCPFRNDFIQEKVKHR